jgi:membrane associated rhomboid family serine protease
MIPIQALNPRLEKTRVTYAMLGAIGVAWVFFQGAALSSYQLAASVCNLGLVPGELTGAAAVGTSVPIGPRLACVVDRSAVNLVTPVTSMFLHGSWGHLLGNALYLWVFGRNVEDSMGPARFAAFYLLCGLGAAAAQVAVAPASPVPMVGASGAISGVLGGYLVLFPRTRVNILFFWLFFVHIISVPAYLVLLWWIGTQALLGLPQLTSAGEEIAAGVAVFAHIGGFLMGLLLVRAFARPELLEAHQRLLRQQGLVPRPRPRRDPDHY